MSAAALQIRCQRCGDPMEMRDPAPGRPWAPQQFWTCTRCGRHFWTTYTTDPNAPPAPKPAAAPVTPATPASPAATS